MRGMFRKHQDGAERAFHGALRPCMSSCCQQEGARGVRLSHSSAPQRGWPWDPAIGVLNRWGRPLELFPSPHLACASSTKHSALPPVSDLQHTTAWNNNNRRSTSDRSEPRYCPPPPRTRHDQQQSEACRMSLKSGQRHHDGTGSGSMIRNTPRWWGRDIDQSFLRAESRECKPQSATTSTTRARASVGVLGWTLHHHVSSSPFRSRHAGSRDGFKTPKARAAAISRHHGERGSQSSDSLRA